VSMLDEGTKTRSATELAAALEDLAVELTGSAGREDMWLHMNSLLETLPKALDLFADVLQNPAYRPEDLERMRGLKITALEQKRGTPPALALDEASRLLFGDKHPWGQPAGGTPETLKRITQADLVKFHDTWVRPNNSVIVVAGDVTPDQVTKLLDERLAGWKSKPLPKLNLPPWPKLARAVSFTDKPNTTQSQVWVVGRLFPAADPDAIPFQTANFAFGGLFTSRLNLDLREEKAYTYGAFSRLSFSRTYGVMACQAGIVAKNTAEALVEFESQMEKYEKGGLEPDELARSKEAYTRTLPSRLETDDAMAGAFAGVSVTGLGPSYYRELPGKIAAVTPEDVLRVVKHVTPESWPIVIVGPAAENADKVRALNLGPVNVKPVPNGAPAASAAGH